MMCHVPRAGMSRSCMAQGQRQAAHTQKATCVADHVSEGLSASRQRSTGSASVKPVQALCEVWYHRVG